MTLKKTKQFLKRRLLYGLTFLIFILNNNQIVMEIEVFKKIKQILVHKFINNIIHLYLKI